MPKESKEEFLYSDEASREKLIKEYWDYQELKGIRREGKEEGLEQGRKEGLEQGREETMHEVVKVMFSNNYTAEQISSALNLKLEYVEEVLNS